MKVMYLAEPFTSVVAKPGLMGPGSQVHSFLPGLVDVDWLRSVVMNVELVDWMIERGYLREPALTKEMVQ